MKLELIGATQTTVIPALVPGTHFPISAMLDCNEPWDAGTSPAMTAAKQTYDN